MTATGTMRRPRRAGPAGSLAGTSPTGGQAPSRSGRTGTTFTATPSISTQTARRSPTDRS
nr:MAG TPA: hypothetical protein [Caudoviricetes sp.]